MKKMVTRKVERVFCDYCKKEIEDENWNGNKEQDFHNSQFNQCWEKAGKSKRFALIGETENE